MVNTGQNPVTELFYGGDSNHTYSRFIFQFNIDRLRNLYLDGTFVDLSKLKHTLRMTNTGAFDKELLGKVTCDGKPRTSSFDLILFNVTQAWDEGTGYDFNDCDIIGGETNISYGPSNWFESRTNVNWSSGPGVYTGVTTVLATQHFEHGNENIEIDVTDVVNNYITGATNNGLGLAFPNELEELKTNDLCYVGFFTRHTQTFYEPHVETIYDNNINDDRYNFYLDKENYLYLYVNLGGKPTNLDNNPGVLIYDDQDVLFSAFTGNQIEQVTKGVYRVCLSVPSEQYRDCLEFTDIWTGLTINGITRPDVELNFVLKSGDEFFNIGENDLLPKQVGINVTGIRSMEKINRGDVRKVFVSVRKPYSIEQKQLVDNIEYRLYVKEGKNEYTVIDYQELNLTSNNNYFLLDTESLIPNTYYLDIKVTSNLEVNTLKDVIKFDIVSISNLRKSQ
jgi:hypothetical protein